MGGFLPSFSVSVFSTTGFDGWDSLEVFPIGVDSSAGVTLGHELTLAIHTYGRHLNTFNTGIQNGMNTYLDASVDRSVVQSSLRKPEYMGGGTGP